MDSRSESKDFDVKSISSSTSVAIETSLNTVVTLPILGKDTKDELPNTGMTCDVKNLWEGKDKNCGCCVNWLEEYPEDVKPNPEETEAVQKFALLVRNRRDHGSGKGMIVSSIVVQSPLLKSLLEEVFEGYEGITTTLKKVTFTAPFEPFFYRWSRFKKAVEDVEDDASRAHAKLLYTVLSKELDETISTYQDLFSHGVMTYKHLWTLYKPGDLLLCEMKGEEMLVRLENSDYDPRMGYRLYCKYVDWDGYNFGYGSHHLTIGHFDGTRAITDLEAYPIQFNSEGAEIESRLAARGRRFEQLQGYHYKLYKGIAELLPVNIGRRYLPASNRTLDGRIIIDAEMHNRFNPANVFLAPLDSVSFMPKLEEDDSGHHRDAAAEDDNVNLYAPPPMPQIISVVPGIPGPIPSDQPIEPRVLAEELYPICSPVLKGYSLKTKNWALFKIDCIHEIAWDDKAFSSLVLPPGYKDLILAFTRNQNLTAGIRADVIEGKGQGIVMLLNGEPGVGKTLTAESVAEHLRVPLYSMSAGQLGVRSEDVEQSLGDILEMATKWKAVLLLDEMEVFLEQRTIDGLERNKLVSIFLRMLEYYRGVLFLTTNHISVLDKAMESRIHLKISYPQLDHAARLQVWRNLVELLPTSSVGLRESDLEFLAQKKMNGREIKNSIKAAQLLASGQESALNLEHILTVLRITQIGESMTAQV